MSEALQWFLENSIQIAAILSVVYSAAHLVAKLTPTKADDIAIEHMQILGAALFDLIEAVKPDEKGGDDEDGIDIDLEL